MDKQIILFGAGGLGYQALLYYGAKNVYCFTDNNFLGATYYDKPVICFEELKKIHKNYKIIVSVLQDSNLQQITAQLHNNNIEFECFDDESPYMKKQRLKKEKYNDFLKMYENNDSFKEEYRFIQDQSKYSELPLIPYNYVNNYIYQKIQIKYDVAKKLHYAHVDNKPLYFPRFWSVESCQKYFNNLLIEQDTNSPHKYFDDKCIVNNNDIFCDVGSAEGYSSLEIIDTAKKVYIFEYDPMWTEALEATFEPYKEKVVIINKMVGDISSKNMVTLDEMFLGTKENIFIKADVEGFECRVIMGAKNLLTNNYLKIALCTYHKYSDAFIFENIFNNYGFSTEFTNGYLLNWKLEKPTFVKGLIKARNF